MNKSIALSSISVDFEKNSKIRDHLLEAVESIIESIPENSRRAFTSDWSQFSQWCESHNCVTLPATPDTVVAYIHELCKTHKVATIRRRLVSITKAHKLNNVPTPVKSEFVRAKLYTIMKNLRVKQDKKAPILTKQLRQILGNIPEDLMGLRDRALLLVGFASGVRRDELVHINVSNFEFKEEGILLEIENGKTDQLGEGRQNFIPRGSSIDTCPVIAIQRWLNVSGISEGAVFRSIDRHGNVGSTALTNQCVALFVKKYVSKHGLESSFFSGHSLRRGFATSAALNGATQTSIQSHLGHKRPEMTLQYIEAANKIKNSAANKLGL